MACSASVAVGARATTAQEVSLAMRPPPAPPLSPSSPSRRRGGEVARQDGHCCSARPARYCSFARLYAAHRSPCAPLYCLFSRARHNTALALVPSPPPSIAPAQQDTALRPSTVDRAGSWRRPAPRPPLPSPPAAHTCPGGAPTTHARRGARNAPRAAASVPATNGVRLVLPVATRLAGGCGPGLPHWREPATGGRAWGTPAGRAEVARRSRPVPSSPP